MPRGTWLAGMGAALLLAGCAAAPKAAAPAAPPLLPKPPAVEASAAPAPPPPASWEDRPLAAGDWQYSGAPAAAEYGETGAPVFSVRCDPARQSIVLERSGAAGALTLRTTFGSRQLPVGPDGRTALPLADPLLDELVSSRGRVAVESAGQPALIVPTWPEPARVVEDCRG